MAREKFLADTFLLGADRRQYRWMMTQLKERLRQEAADLSGHSAEGTVTNDGMERVTTS